MTMTIKEDIKLASEQAKCKKYCEYCGHTMTFYAFEKERKLCTWCGKYNYKNDKVQFKDLLLKKRKEVEE
jgi:uncharacterized protein (DUF983 family)